MTYSTKYFNGLKPDQVDHKINSYLQSLPPTIELISAKVEESADLSYTDEHLVNAFLVLEDRDADDDPNEVGGLVYINLDESGPRPGEEGMVVGVCVYRTPFGLSPCYKVWYPFKGGRNLEYLPIFADPTTFRIQTVSGDLLFGASIPVGREAS